MPCSRPDGVVSKLLQAEPDAFVKVIVSETSTLEQLRVHWESFVERETASAKKLLQTDIVHRAQLVHAERMKRDSAAKHLSTHRSRSASWAALVSSVETTRYHATRQDFKDHAEFVENEWEKLRLDLLRILNPESLVGHEIWSLDVTEGPGRIRKKLTASIRDSHVRKGPKHRTDRSRTFGITRQGSDYLGVPRMLFSFLTRRRALGFTAG